MSDSGEFKRVASGLRDVVRASPSAAFPAAAGRYVLYAAHACPWSSRCLAVIKMKGLQHAIRVVYVEPKMEKLAHDPFGEEEGWVLKECADPVFGARTIRELYDKATPSSKDAARVASVPVFLDTRTRTILNNESADIMHFLNSEFNQFAERPEVDLFPILLRDAIITMNDRLYEAVNNGVYKCGFAKTQAAYDKAFDDLFNRLDELEFLLGTQRFLIEGATAPTESDVRLFVTLIRFDEVYHTHFKCNKYAIRECPNLHGWLRDMWQWDHGVLQSTVKMDQIKTSYYSMSWINPNGIVARGPDSLALLKLPHSRARLTPMPSAVPSSRASAQSNEVSPNVTSLSRRKAAAMDARSRPYISAG
jgi:putative glutathione S-transferase